jgi:hypothetical protein
MAQQVFGSIEMTVAVRTMLDWHFVKKWKHGDFG